MQACACGERGAEGRARSLSALANVGPCNAFIAMQYLRHKTRGPFPLIVKPDVFLSTAGWRVWFKLSRVVSIDSLPANWPTAFEEEAPQWSDLGLTLKEQKSSAASKG